MLLDAVLSGGARSKMLKLVQLPQVSTGIDQQLWCNLDAREML
jgi:hypothetical protein